MRLPTLRHWRRQTGGVLLLGVGAILLALSTLAVVDVGHVFYVKRELQKTADLSALAGAQFPGNCDHMKTRASANAARNDTATPDLTLGLTCGNWAADRPAETRFQAGDMAPNAVRVVATQDVPFFILNYLGGERSKRVSAQSTAANPVDGGFLSIHSIGTGVARADLNAGMLNPLLSGLLRTNVSLDLVSYQGLADAKVRLLDIVRADPINIGSVDGLAGAQVSLYDFVLATANASPDNLVKTTLLNNFLGVALRDLNLDLGSVLQLGTLDPSTVAQASLSALDLVMLAAQVANGSNAVALNTGLPLVDLKLSVIEAPQYAIGTIGATARSAQIRLQVTLKLSTLSIPLLLTLNNVHVLLDVASGQAVLTEAACEPRREDCMVGMDVTTGVVKACVTDNPATDINNCTGRLTLANVTLAGLVGAKVGLNRAASIQPADTQAIVFGPGSGQNLLIEDETPYHVPSSVGSTLTSLLTGVFNTVTAANVDLTGVVGSLLGFLLEPLVNTVLTALNGLLSATIVPLVSGLAGTLIDPLLSQLGLSLGYSDVRHIKLFCNEPILVN